MEEKEYTKEEFLKAIREDTLDTIKILEHWTKTSLFNEITRINLLKKEVEQYDKEIKEWKEK